MHNKKVQLVALSIVFVLALAAGGWLLLGGQKDADSGAPDPSQIAVTPPDSPVETIDPQDEALQFKMDQQESTTGVDLSGYLSTIFRQGSRLVQLRNGADEDSWLEIVDLDSGEVLRTYSYSDISTGGSDVFFNFCVSGEDVWSLIYDNASGCFSAGVVGADQRADLGSFPFKYNGGVEKFAVWEKYIILYGMITDDTSSVFVCDMENGTQQEFKNVRDFCLDDNGGMYYIGHNSTQLIKQDLAANGAVWHKNVASHSIYLKLWYQPDAGLFVLCSPDGSILRFDPEKGKEDYELFNMATDSELSYIEMYAGSFAVDNSYRVHFLKGETDYANPEFLSSTLQRWRFSPYIPQADESGVVTLTITAPYKPESLATSVQMYQKEHPGVQIQWDTMYDSQQDFIAHMDQYVDQITLRTMTGDVGDIQMVGGSGMDVNAILATNVMTDLSAFLDSCPHLDELNTAQLEGMRGEDGAIRAIPLHIQSQFMVFNRTLADQLGLTLDPEKVTWSELLALAAKWEEEGADYSVFARAQNAVGDVRQFADALMVANLDTIVPEDGPASIQPWLRDLLSALNRLRNSPHFCRHSGGQFWWSPGNMDSSLFAIASGANYEDYFGNLADLEEASGIEVQIVPLPLGEYSQGRAALSISFGIPESAENKEAAWELLEFITSSDGFATDMYDRGGFSLNNVSDRERFDAVKARRPDIQDEHYEQFQAVRNSPVSFAGLPASYGSAIMGPILEYFNGERSLDDALELAIDRWNRAQAE